MDEELVYALGLAKIHCGALWLVHPHGVRVEPRARTVINEHAADLFRAFVHALYIIFVAPHHQGACPHRPAVRESRQNEYTFG